MMSSQSNFKSILTLKCPKCHEGDLFCNKNLYQPKDFFKMPDHCPKCGQNYMLEPGFYFGAMYVSYGLTIALNVAVFVALLVFDSYTVTNFLVLDFFVLMVTLPFILKASRSIWIDIMIKYDPNAIKDYAARNKSK